MDQHISDSHPLKILFRQAVHDALADRLGLREFEDVEAYLAHLLVTFLHNERIFAIRDAAGRPVRSIPEMLAEGDVRLNAGSFEREREVHHHVGDFLLFWSGLFPEALERALGGGATAEAIRQGKASYLIVSTFDYVPYDKVAPTFSRLSEAFEECREGLSLVRREFGGLMPGGS